MIYVLLGLNFEQMKNIYTKLLILIIPVLIISCGKTDEDIDREERIIGEWFTTEVYYSYTSDTVFFVFEKENKGRTIVNEVEDDFSWEIKRGTLKTYYKTAPRYTIGYDKYNSKGVYKITGFNDNEIEFIQYFYNGTQTEASIYKLI